ncbi:hypothetical protein J6590_072855 [Homalodisca vitripennis]|nr:hypothetical protein J6590_072855 [Homalodisca vitripennis]
MVVTENQYEVEVVSRQCLQLKFNFQHGSSRSLELLRAFTLAIFTVGHKVAQLLASVNTASTVKRRHIHLIAVKYVNFQHNTSRPPVGRQLEQYGGQPRPLTSTADSASADN